MPYPTLFPGQEPDEKIILVLRRHAWHLFKMIFIYAVLLILPFLLHYILIIDTEALATALGLLFYKMFLSLYYFALITFFYRSWIDYYLDIWVITSERIVNIEQQGLFSREISSFRLFRIQDVSADVKGLLSTFFHFGDVHVQTAGAESNFIFKQVPDPYRVTKKIMELVDWKKKHMLEPETTTEGIE